MSKLLVPPKQECHINAGTGIIISATPLVHILLTADDDDLRNILGVGVTLDKLMNNDFTFEFLNEDRKKE